MRFFILFSLIIFLLILGFKLNYVYLLYSNYEFLFYLSIFYSIYILYKKGKNLQLINKSPIELNKNIGSWFQKFWFFITLLLLNICFYFLFKNILSNNNISISDYRIIKLILGFFISTLTLYLSIKEKGFISWRTLFSIISLCILIFYAILIFDQGWKIFIFEKLSSYIIACSAWFFIFISFFSYDYLYISNIDITNNLKIKLINISEWELVNKPDLMKIEDLLNKEDLDKKNNQTTSENTGFKKIKVEDILNKGDSVKSDNSSNTNNKSIADLSLSNKNKNSDSILSKINSNNILNTRPTTSDSSDTASNMSYDSSLSNAHICIVEGTKQLIESAEAFTNQWNEGKILGEDAKEKKEMLDEILDLPDKKVFKLLNWRIDWEYGAALRKYINKRNMLAIPGDKIVLKASTSFNETMSDNNEKQKFWNKLKAYVKEPIKNEKDTLEKIRKGKETFEDEKDILEMVKKETFKSFIKGEEESITTGNKKKTPLEVGGRRLKKGGLIAVYEDKKIEAEATIQQQELRALKRGIEIKRIIPSYGRLSIFEIMNQSVGSVINDFKKLNLDSSTSSNENSDSEVKSDSVKLQSNLKDEIKVNINDSSIINDNNMETSKSKSILIKDDNDEINKKRRIN
jgi:hypothetical protein